MKLHTLAGAVALAFAVAGCTTYHNLNENEAGAHDSAAFIQQRMAQGNAASHADDTVQYLDKPWVSFEPIMERYQDPSTKYKCHIAIGTLQPITLQEFAQSVMQKCKVGVRVTRDAVQYLNSNTTPIVGMPSPTMVTASGTVVPAIASRPAGVGIDEDKKIDLNYEGDLDDVMQIVTDRLGLSYSREPSAGGSVNYTIYAIGTKTFRIHMIGGDIDMRSQFDSGTTQVTGATSNGAGGNAGGMTSGSEGQGQSNTLQHVQSAIKGNLWAEMKETLLKMGNVTAEPTNGSVTVNDNADVIARVKSYVDDKNKIFDKFVTFQVNVYSVTLSSNDSLGVNWNLVWRNLAGKGFSLANVFTAPINAVTGTYSVLNTSTSPWAGTDAMLSALNTIGSAKLTRSTSVPAMNLTLASTQSGTQDGYLAQSSLSQTAQVGSTTSLTPGQINTGFNISLLPNVLEDNSMLLKFQINLSTNNGIRTVTSGGSTVELPSIGLPLNQTVTVPLNPNQTLLLTGQDFEDTNGTRQGLGSPSNWLLGGGVNATKNRTMMVVMITPTLADKNNYANR